MLNNMKPTMAALPPLAALGAGAFLSEGAQAGLHLGGVARTGDVVVVQAAASAVGRYC